MTKLKVCIKFPIFQNKFGSFSKGEERGEKKREKEKKRRVKRRKEGQIRIKNIEVWLAK